MINDFKQHDVECESSEMSKRFTLSTNVNYIEYEKPTIMYGFIKFNVLY